MSGPRTALLWKEWREQRWRFMLGVAVLAMVSASLVRAQLLPITESTLLVFGPIGLALAVFFAMGSVATERADHTWPFLLGQPVSRAEILRTKWMVGAAHLALALLLAGAASHWAGQSRGVFSLPRPYTLGGGVGVDWLMPENSPAWLWLVVLRSGVALLAWYTVLFFVLTRARNELHAGIGGVLLTLLALAWLLEYFFAGAEWHTHGRESIELVFRISALLNPLAPGVMLQENTAMQLLALTICATIWIVGPLWLVGRLRGEEPLR